MSAGALSRAMHELAIAEGVVSGVCETVGNARVVRVVLEIGKLSGVMPDSIRFCFDLAAQGTPLEGATLEILQPPSRVRCRSCGASFEPRDALAFCECGSADVETLSGQQLKIRGVEVI